ncbi:MAG: hypothetical protein AAGB93_21650 [Planctomycetota bacterium]
MICLQRASSRVRAAQQRRRGAALLAVTPLAMLMVAMMVAFMATTLDASRAGTSALDSFRARAAAQSAASLAIADLWGDFEAIGGSDQQIWVFRGYLDGIGLSDQSGAPDPARTDYLPTLALAADAQGDAIIGGIEIERVDVHRLDTWDSTSLVVEVDAVMRLGEDGSSRERRSSIQETFTVAPPDWDGLDFALLANNVNCLLCHTTIDNVERIYNQDTDLYGTFDQVRVGSIDAIHFREDPDSNVAGVMLIGGDAIEGNGDSIVDWTAFNLTSTKRDGSMLHQDAFGDLVHEGLRVFDSASPDASANLYLDFFSYGADAAFGLNLPETFPAPFADNGGYDFATGSPMPELADNGIIDDSEFEVTIAGLSGTMSGGTIAVVPPGETFDPAKVGVSLSTAGGGSPPAGGAGAGAGSGGGSVLNTVPTVTDGNIYLHGTVDDPLLLDGDVAVDGDVVISGFVKGRGTIRARGNVYVTSDLVYADKGGPASSFRTYGVADDGTENNLAIAAGGNIVVGDFYRPAWGSGDATDGTKGTSYNFTMEELAIFNRMEWIKTQPTLPGKETYGETGKKTIYVDEMIDQTYTVNQPIYGKQPYTVQEPVYANVPYLSTQPIYAKQPYTVDEPVYGIVKTGKVTQKPVYKTVTKTNGLPKPYTKTWNEKVLSHYDSIEETKKVQTGTKKVTKYNTVKVGSKPVIKHKKVQTGTKSVTKYKTVQTGSKPVTKTKKVPSGKKIAKEQSIKGHYTPQHANPYYRPGHTPRYYNFTEGQKIPIFNKDGYFDPSNQHWMSDELAEGWDDDKLSYADPSDPGDPFLYDGTGKPAAVISSVTPTDGWIERDVLRDMIGDALAENPDGDKTIEIDATLYSSNAILGMIPDRNSDHTNGKLRVNGGLVAADVGILAPMGTEVNYDVRGARALSISADNGLVISRRFSAPRVRY